MSPKNEFSLQTNENVCELNVFIHFFCMSIFLFLFSIRNVFPSEHHLSPRASYMCTINMIAHYHGIMICDGNDIAFDL